MKSRLLYCLTKIINPTQFITMTKLFKNKLARLFLPLVAISIFVSCQKDLSDDSGAPGNPLPDLTTKVKSSVSGFVTDENNTAVLGASVSVGGTVTTTDKYGFFEVKNVQVGKTAAVVTVNKAGYFKGIKTYIGEQDKAAFFRIKLIPKANSGSINAATGGSVTLSNGLIVALPANAVVNAGSNAAYTGTVTVASHWIDPTATDLNQVMPGDLRGISTDGGLKTLTTYGMAAVELTGASGELLQVATSKKATLTMPLPAAISGSAPASIPLWSFDETNGLWKQEGEAIKTGNTYVGEVSHFSFWNCDVPNNFVQFNCTVKDASGDPIPYAVVKISSVSNPYNAAYGYTDSSGYVSGAVPGNAQLKIEVFTYYGCSTSLFTQTFTTTNVNYPFGTITVNNTSNLASITGTVTNCTGAALTNGYIVILEGNSYYRYPLTYAGGTSSFDITRYLCNSSISLTFIAEDMVGLQQSSPVTQTINAGANSLGNMQACGVTTQQFITWSINGAAATTFSAPGDSLFHSGNGTTSMSNISGWSLNTQNNIGFSFDNAGLAAGSTQILTSFLDATIGGQVSFPTPIQINISEYGAVGQYIGGSFSGNFITINPSNSYTVTCTFRVRRSF